MTSIVKDDFEIAKVPKCASQFACHRGGNEESVLNSTLESKAIFKLAWKREGISGYTRGNIARMVDAVALTKRAVLIQRGIIRLALTNAQIKYFRTAHRRLRFRRWKGSSGRDAPRCASSRAIDRATSPIIPPWRTHHHPHDLLRELSLLPANIYTFAPPPRFSNLLIHIRIVSLFVIARKSCCFIRRYFSFLSFFWGI